MESPHQILEIATGARLKSLRLDEGLTIEGLAEISGVSRAMISRIERGETSPTAALLARLVQPLGQSLSSFFALEKPGEPFLPAARQHVWTDPETGYVRRSVSPPGTGSCIDIVEISLPAGRQVSFPPQASSVGTMQHVWVLEGRLTLAVKGAVHEMAEGDCLFHDIGLGHSFSNKGTKPVRYAVVLEHRRNG